MTGWLKTQETQGRCLVLQAKNIPVMIAANKVDLKKSNIKKIEGAFPQYPIVGISAKYGEKMEDFYDALFKLVK